jgi:hypothetical protein
MFHKIKQYWINFRIWYHRHRKLFWIYFCVFIVILTAGGVTAFILLNKKPPEPILVKKVEKPKPIIKYYSPLTGSEVKSTAETTLPVTGVMVENSPNSRPQSGLKKGGVVFEAIAEGGITRFMVLYQTEKPKLIGPVRSLRLYDVDWLAAFNASIAHVGGSAAALAEIRNGKYRDLDQFFNPSSFWRTTDRYAPHNVYTDYNHLNSLNKSKGYTKSIFTGFERSDGKPVKKPNASTISIVISSALYNSTYKYIAKCNCYGRSQAGAPHNDRELGQITPSVVIAMRVNEKTVLEDGYRQSIATIGNGKAVIFQNGTAIKATWHKTSKKSQIKFKDAKGKEISLARGQTWIAAVPNDGGDVSWK